MDAEIHKLIDEVHPHYLTIPGIEPGINNSGTESYDGRMVNHGSSQLHETCEVNQLILTNTNETCEQLNLTSYVEFCFLFRVRTGRGMGFRDSCQDLLGFVHLIPDCARQKILDIAATQFEDGSGFNDDPL